MRCAVTWLGPEAVDDRTCLAEALNDTNIVRRTHRGFVGYVIIVKVAARSVAGKLWRTRGWTGRSPSRTEYDVDVPYTVKKGLSIAGFLSIPALN